MNSLIKLVISCVAVIGFAVSSAQAWDKVLACENLVLDTGTTNYGGVQYQMVLTGDALDYFKSRNAVPEYMVNEMKREAVVPISRNLKVDGYVYYGSVYMSMGQPNTVAYYDITPTESGFLIVFNRPGTPDRAEYWFNRCGTFRQP